MRALRLFLSVGLFLVPLFMKSLAAEEEDNEEYYDETVEEYSDISGSGDDQSDYQYSYSYQDYKDVESELDILPQMISLSQSIIVKKGETAKLPCQATDSSQLVRIWQRDDGNVIFTGNVKVSRQENHHLDTEQNTTLVITDAQPHDAGSYTCRVMIRARDEISVSHRLIVNTQAFLITPVPEDGLLNVAEGEDILIQCKVTGEEVPESTNGTIRWNKEGSRFRDGSYTLTGDLELPIENVTKADAGKYFCTAASTKGEAKSTHVEVIVQFKPEIVSLTKAKMETGRGLEGELTCLSVGEPAPKVTWYKGHEVVQLDDRKSYKSAGYRHILLIKRMNPDDIGTYMCYTINELGSAQDTIEVSMEDLNDIPTGLSDANVKSFDDYSKKETIGINLEVIESFKEKIENDLAQLRNLTYSLKKGSEKGDSTFDASVFGDLQRLQLELRQFQTISEAHAKEIKTFERTAKDDFQRIWDHVNELQEVTNITTKHMEDIYDKDILPLQNFKALAEAKLIKLREDVDESMKSSFNSPSTSNTSEVALIMTKTKRILDHLEEEQMRQKVQLEKLTESQTLVRGEIQKIFQDIDSFKKQSAFQSQDTLMLQRELQGLQSGTITDLSHKLESHARRLDDLDHHKEKSLEDLKDNSVETDQKFSIMVKEMQAVKSQIYYLQQSILQLRGAIKSSSSGGETSLAPLPPTFVSPNDITELHSKVNSCAQQNDMERIQALVDSRSAQFKDALSQVNAELNSAKENVIEILTKSEAEIRANAEKIQDIETAERKYNLVIKGLPQERKLERPTHLEMLVKKFFRQTLRLTGLNFEEAERLSCPQVEGEDAKCAIKVRFSSVREKIKVLQAGRIAANNLRNKGITLIEDFTDKVLQHRQSLALFARRRARKTKKKWALKYNELYFDGKIFIWNDQAKKVEEKLS